MKNRANDEIDFLLKSFHAGDGNKKTFKERLIHLYMTGNITEKAYDSVCSSLDLTSSKTSSASEKTKIVYVERDSGGCGSTDSCESTRRTHYSDGGCGSGGSSSRGGC